ncbi:AlpA family phage regulatory protein [Sphingomonas sabuli]|uniref:AlpA family phage regulatory protein n=1 Tax=Sphingomonas sabuli TaxID=2764186 RepID=A0A7G9L1A1_9SPHN|nr:AlpA family phage regulatory protein [Sphingomonas sabuli]
MSTPENNLLGLKRVREMTSLGKSTIYRMIAGKQFPRPLRLSERRVAWRQSDINDWLDTRAKS